MKRQRIPYKDRDKFGITQEAWPPNSMFRLLGDEIIYDAIQIRDMVVVQ